MPNSRKRTKSQPAGLARTPTWVEKDGIHALLPGHAPSQEELESLSREYRAEVRQSPLWDLMVNEYGHDAAERLLLTFRAEVRP